MVLFFIAFCTAPFSSKHFRLELFVRSLFTQLFYLVVLFLLLLSMTAFSHVKAPFSLLCVTFCLFLFFCWAVFHPALSLLVLFSPICWAWIHSPFSFFSQGLFFGLLVFSNSVLGNFQGCFDILSSFFGFVLRLFCLYWFCWFQLFKGLIFLIHLRAFSSVFFYRAFLSGSVLSSTPYIGLLCLLRMHAINSCVGDTWQRLWRDGFTHNGKQAVNRLKIPQGLSTLMFRRWSEVPSRGGVRGDSP